MNEFHQLARRTLRNTALVTALYAILWAVWRHNSVLAGLVFGSAVSLYFVFSSTRQAELAAAVALRETRRRPGILAANRIAVMVGVILLANVLEPKIGYVSPLGLLVGFFTNQFVLLAGFVYNKFKTS